MSAWWVYVLASAGPPPRTYVGVSIDPERRLRQHNGAAPKGAARTRAGRPWRIARLLGPFPDRGTAQREEAKIKRLSGKARLD